MLATFRPSAEKDEDEYGRGDQKQPDHESNGLQAKSRAVAPTPK
jgi:hypothetical protein